jgi:hypothetical protein
MSARNLTRQGSSFCQRGGVLESLTYVFASQLGALSDDVLRGLPFATEFTTRATAIRVPRIRFRPPMTAVPNVIRSNIRLVYQPVRWSVLRSICGWRHIAFGAVMRSVPAGHDRDWSEITSESRHRTSGHIRSGGNGPDPRWTIYNSPAGLRRCGTAINFAKRMRPRSVCPESLAAGSRYALVLLVGAGWPTVP